MKNMHTLGPLTLFALLSVAPLSAQTPWKEYTPPFGDTIAIADLEVVNENVIWAVGLRLDVNDSLFNYFFPSKTYIALTKDGGATWSVDTVPMGVNPFVASYVIMCGTSGSILKEKLFTTWISPDRGSTWKEVSTGQIASWITFLNAKVGWAGESQQLSHQTKLYQYTGSPLVGLLTPAPLDADVMLSPNPASDVARVQVRAQEAADFLLLLNDSQGNLLRSIEVKGVDGFDKDLNVSDLPAGIYTVTVSTAKGSVSRRLTKG